MQDVIHYLIRLSILGALALAYTIVGSFLTGLIIRLKKETLKDYDCLISLIVIGWPLFVLGFIFSLINFSKLYSWAARLPKGALSLGFALPSLPSKIVNKPLPKQAATKQRVSAPKQNTEEQELQKIIHELDEELNEHQKYL